MKQVTVVKGKKAHSATAPPALKNSNSGYELKNTSKIVGVSSSKSAAFVLRSIIYPSTKAHEAMRTQSSNLNGLLP